MNFTDILFASFVLLVVASIDVFALGFSYGTRRVRVPMKGLLVVSLIGSLFILTSLLLGFFLGDFLPGEVARWLSFSLFMGVGLSRVILWFFNRKKQKKGVRPITMKELVFLAIFLSLDGIGVGVGTGLGNITLIFIFSIFAVSIFTDILMFKVGQATGDVLANRLMVDLGWVGGVALMLVAIGGLFL